MGRPGIVLALAAGAALSLPAAAALAQATPYGEVTRVAPEIPSGWRFELQPFASIPVDVNGDARVRNREVPIDVSGGEILDRLRMAALLRFEAWNGHFGLAAEGMYTRLVAEQSPGALPFDYTARTFVGDLQGAYRVGPGPLSFGGTVMLDLFAGLRILRLGQDLEIGGEDLDAHRTTAKALGSLRGLVRLSRMWVLGIRSTVAGPDMEWSVGGAAELDVSRLAIKLGYSVDHFSSSSDRSDVETTSHGPYLGLGIRFGSGPIY